MATVQMVTVRDIMQNSYFTARSCVKWSSRAVTSSSVFSLGSSHLLRLFLRTVTSPISWLGSKWHHSCPPAVSFFPWLPPATASRPVYSRKEGKAWKRSSCWSQGGPAHLSGGWKARAVPPTPPGLGAQALQEPGLGAIGTGCWVLRASAWCERLC